MKKFWWVLLGIFALMIVPLHPVQAVGSSFTIQPVYPDDTSKGRGYYDMTVKPDTTVPLSIVVRNITDSTKQLKVSVADAYSANNGQVAYDPNGPRDDSAKLRLSDLAGKPVMLKLAGQQQQEVTFNIKVPKAGITGELIGSLYVIDTDSYGNNQNQGVGIKNKFAMYTAVVMRTNDTYVRPDLHLRKFDLDARNGKAEAFATLQNYKPQAFGQMTITAKVYHNNGSKPVLTRTASDYSMAPNSHFDFEIPSDKAFTSGDYKLDLLATSGKRRWHFTRTIHVSQAQAAKIDKSASLKMPGLPWWVIALIVLLVLFILILLFLLFKRRKKDDEEASKK